MTSQEWLRDICNNDFNHRAYAIAEEIDRLQTENKKLREALENIKKHYEVIGFHELSGAYHIASKALAGGE